MSFLFSRPTATHNGPPAASSGSDAATVVETASPSAAGSCTSRKSTRPTRTMLAMAVAGAMLAACQVPGDTPGSRVDQLNNLHGPTKVLAFEFHEGTNMAASPSPDGRHIVFSAQGALWVMPSAGGAATRITSWRVEPTQPVWSPDGKTIAFQNYAPEGNYHMWTVDPHGRHLKEHTTGPYDDREPSWLPDSSGLVFSSDRSHDGQYKIWMVNLRSGALTQLTRGPGAESNPVVSNDGQRLAYVDGANVLTLALAGPATPVTVAPGTAPQWAPDNTSLIYQNADRQLVVGGAVVTNNEDLFPFPVHFLRNGRFLYTADGKIRSRSMAGADPLDIPFSAALTVRRPAFTKVKPREFDNFAPRQVMGVSAPAISPDGKSIAFVALNDVWVMQMGQAPVRLTNDTDRDGNPQWTPDGSAIYFSSERGNAGQLAIDQIVLATRVRTRLAALPGRSMVLPKMSPTGDRIAYTTLSGQLEIWHVASRTSEVIIPSVSTQVSTPQWTPDGQRIMVVDNERINNRFREGYNKLRVIELATRSARFVEVAPEPRQIAERDEGAAVLSPDGTKVAFIMDSLLHIMRVNADLSPAGPALRLTSEVADLPSWSGDSGTILYKSADKLKTIAAEGGGSREIPLSLHWAQAVPSGSTLIHASAMWDGLSPSLRHDVDIVVTNNRITSIGAHQDSNHTGATRVIDASGQTVMPGLIDPHVHPLTLYQGGQFGQVAALMLSYGLTSTQSVGGPLHQSVELREALEAGNLIGPRLFISPPLWEGNRLF
jgi:Tol biopolymer transport system component